VRVNAIAPGIIVTGLLDELESQLGDQAGDAFLALRTAIPLGRFGTPEEAANPMAADRSDPDSHPPPHTDSQGARR
jgi:NAD(P)-dependent dehydrogenase (short-subunit alcohol dehydrogenase family)